MRIEYELSEAEFREAIRVLQQNVRRMKIAGRSKKRRVITSAITLTLMVVLATVVALAPRSKKTIVHDPASRESVVAFAIVAVGAAAVGIYLHLTSRGLFGPEWAKRNPNFGPATVDYNDREANFYYSNADHRFAWREFLTIQETEHCLLLAAKTVTMIVPKRAFESFGAMNEFCVFARSGIFETSSGDDSTTK